MMPTIEPSIRASLRVSTRPSNRASLPVQLKDRISPESKTVTSAGAAADCREQLHRLRNATFDARATSGLSVVVVTGSMSSDRPLLLPHTWLRPHP